MDVMHAKMTVPPSEEVVFPYQRSVKCQCNAGFYHSHGDLVRRCQVNGLWSGIPPVCQGKCRNYKMYQFLAEVPVIVQQVLEVHIACYSVIMQYTIMQAFTRIMLLVSFVI